MFKRRRLRLIEESGMMLKHLLKYDPWSKLECQDQFCNSCKGEEGRKGACGRRGQVYENICLICKGQGRSTRYVGETARTCRERNKEHQRDALGLPRPGDTKVPRSHMREHTRE